MFVISRILAEFKFMRWFG